MDEKGAVSGQAASPEKEAAERLWHMKRGFEAAFFIVFVVLVFGLVFHQTGYDVYLDGFLGSRVAAGGIKAAADATASGRDAISTGWMWWLVSYGLWRIGGAWLAAVFAGLLVTAGFGALLGLLRRSVNVVVAAAVLAAAAYLGRRYFAPGGQAAGVFLFAALAALLTNAVSSSGRRVWFAAGIMALWVNIDLSWTAGAALCAGFIPVMLFTSPNRKMEKTLALAAALAATLVNPDFVRAYEAIWRLPVDPRSAYAFVAPSAGRAVWGMLPLYVGTGFAIVLAFSARGLTPVAFITTAFLILAAGVSVWVFPIAALAVGGAIAASLPGFIGWACSLVKGPAGEASKKWVVTILVPGKADAQAGVDDDPAHARKLFGLSMILADAGIIAVLALFYFTVASSQSYRLGYAAEPAGLPRGAAAFVKANNIRGTALTHPNWAGYLLQGIYPGANVICDTKPLSADEDTVMAVSWAFGMPAKSGAGAIIDALTRSKVTFAVVPQRWPRALDFRGAFAPVYWDDVSAVLVPNVPPNAALIAAHDESLTYPPYFGFGLTQERLPEAIAALQKKLAEGGESAYANYELGICFLRRGDREAAAASLLMALGTNPTLPEAYHWLGDMVSSDKGDFVTEKILAAFSQYSQLGGLLAGVRGTSEAGRANALRIFLYSQAIRCNRDFAMAYLKLGQVLLESGDTYRGIQNLREARSADDRRPQLGRETRRQLEEQIVKLTTPQPRPLAVPPAQGGAGQSGGSEGAPPAAGEAGAPGASEPPIGPPAPASGPAAGGE